MKRFWLVMLSLGLVLAFSASAMAVDVKFSGSFYAAGMYLDKVTLKDKVSNAVVGDTYAGTSTAFYYQRLRVGTDFIVSPGLKLVTRFDALERIWGGIRTSATAAGPGVTLNSDNSSAGTRAESENIAFDNAYIQYISPIGLFQVGYMPSGTLGHSFGDSEFNGAPTAKIMWAAPIGPVTVGAAMEKVNDTSFSYRQTTTATDRDYEKYSAFAIYKVNKDIETGLGFEYRNINLQKGAGATTPDAVMIAAYPLDATSYALNPYVKAKIGPVTVVAEGTYAWGKATWERANPGEGNAPASVDDVKIENMRAILDVNADFKMVYGGMTFAYISGDDPGTTDKLEGGIALGGKDFNPCLILFNYDRTYWVGSMPGWTYNANYFNVGGTAPYVGGASPTAADNEMNNVWFFQGKVGVRPVAALDINVSLAYANADKKPAGTAASRCGITNNAYGWELDITGTYKITNNLSYMLGAGYLWTGDYFKGDQALGASNENGLNNNYMLTNKLTLTF